LLEGFKHVVDETLSFVKHVKLCFSKSPYMYTMQHE